MTGRLKNVASPFSTGGGGLNFETRIQASFAVLMLAGGFSPCLRGWPIEKIQLQGKHLGYETDDLIVFVQDPQSKQQAKLLGQIKHDISFTEANSTFEEVIIAAWADFNNSKCFSSQDAIALISGPLNSTDLQVRTILEWARSCSDSTDFINKVELTNFSSKTKRQKLNVIRKHLKTANGGNDVSDDNLWSFLRVFYLLNYDLDIESGVNLALLHSLINQYNIEAVNGIWSQIVDKVQTINQNAGIICKSNLPDEVLEAFQKPVKAVVETMPTELVKLAASEVSVSLNTITYTYATELAIAQLVGSWNESHESDRAVVEQVSGEQYDTWVHKLREVLALPNSPLKYKEGVWSVKNKLELWRQMGGRVFDDHLDRLKTCAISVLREIDPKFEMPTEERYTSAVYGKILQHSASIRKGIADSLALIGSHPEALTNCSASKLNSVATLTVREVFSEASWLLWGSLNSLLPVLAEAAPEEFLSAVERAVGESESPFDELFAQEGSGFTGGNYITGLLWGLEGLAWHPDYLSRVSVVLGELDSHDPGGNWSNRPANSLVDIFLPWLPHTMASVTKRKAAMQTLRREFPETAWKVLLKLLPNQTRSTSGNYKPQWREFIPSDWKKEVSHEDYWAQVEYFSECVVQIASADFNRLSELVQYIDHLTETTFEKAIKAFEQAKEGGLSVEQRYEVWEALTRVVTKHRKYPDADWSLPEDYIEKLDGLAEMLQPESPEKLYIRLFSGRDDELYDEIGDWEQQRKNLEERREKAIQELQQTLGFEGVLNFALTVESPQLVGYSLGKVIGADKENKEKTVIKTAIESCDNKLEQFIAGYVRERYQTVGDLLLQQLDVVKWEKPVIAKLLTYLLFNSKVWEQVEELLGDEDALYWSQVEVRPYLDKENMYYVIEKLLVHNRPVAAIEFLYRLLRDKHELDVEYTVKVLISAASSTEPCNSLHTYYLTEIIKHLQNRDDVSDEDLFQVEWAYLPLLEDRSEATPAYLEYKLASEPEFFCQIIRWIFRSKHEEAPRKFSESDRKAATNAYSLLHDWRIPPGMDKGGDFYGDRFTDWLNKMIKSCEESGHLEVALSQLGKVLIHAPSDPSGLWIHHSVAEALNRKDLDGLRNGYRVGLFNSRGVHSVDPTGKPEKQLAKKYRQCAEDVEEHGFQRFAVTLRQLAESYDQDALRIISESKDRNDF
jgi:hypothetical protein